MGRVESRAYPLTDDLTEERRDALHDALIELVADLTHRRALYEALYRAQVLKTSAARTSAAMLRAQVAAMREEIARYSRMGVL